MRNNFICEKVEWGEKYEVKCVFKALSICLEKRIF